MVEVLFSLSTELGKIGVAPLTTCICCVRVVVYTPHEGYSLYASGPYAS